MPQVDDDGRDYREVNRAHWNGRAPAHFASPGYAVRRFAEDPAFLSDVVRFDVPLLGDLAGVRGVHLQCHIGTDTVSLARLGARMTGLDLSPTSVEQARKVAEAAGAEVDFVVADVYDAPAALGGERFDLVFTGVGALCWLPSIEDWAGVVAALLAPGGRLFVREGHPALWAVDEEQEDRIVVDFPYFETAEALVWEDAATYVETDAVFEANVTKTWNHGLGELVTALLDRGLTVTGLVEHRSVPWQALPGQMTLDETTGEWALTDRRDRLPLSYTLQAVQPA